MAARGKPDGETSQGCLQLSITASHPKLERVAMRLGVYP